MKTPAPARLVVRAASWMIPPGERAEWREEWDAELAALARRGAGSAEAIRFAVGALPTALARGSWWRPGPGTLQDIRVGVRALARRPLFTVVAVVTLALGIGSNTALFAVVNGIVLRGVPGVEDPERVVQVGRSYPGSPGFDNWSWPTFELFADETSRVFRAVAGYQRSGAVLGSGTAGSAAAVQLVTGRYFDVLGVRPSRGRLLDDGDVQEGAAPVAVLSHATWMARYGGEPSAIGRSIRVNGEPHRIVGVAPPGFVGVEKVGTPPALWLPVTRWAALRGYPAETPFEQWDWSWLSVVARLRPGATVPQARALIESLAADRAAAMPWYFEDLVPVVAAGVGLDPDGRREGRRIALLLAGVGALVLLITCANVANLLLARGSTRRGEIGVRLALGAGQLRLVRQLMAENLVLAAAGVLAALPLAWGAEALRPVLFPGEPGLDLTPDLGVLAFTTAVGVVALGLFGVVPALSAARGGRLATGLREDGSGPARTTVRSGLVVLQLALCLGLLAGAGSLLRSLWNARVADPGFQADRILAVDVHFGHLERYRGGTPGQLLERLRRAAADVPGVTGVTWSSPAPVADFQSRGTVRSDLAPDPTEPGVTAELVVVGADYFATLGVPLLRGRGPGDEDVAADRAVAVVSRSLADQLWGEGSDPRGRSVVRGGEVPVVGVAEAPRLRGVDVPPRPTLWLTRDESVVPPRQVSLLLRTVGPPLSIAAAATAAVTAVDAEITVVRTLPLRSALVGSLSDTATIGWLVTILAGLALTLAGVGLFGVLAFSVEQRRRELGIRKALGAPPAGLVRLVLRNGLTLALAGTVVGTGVAWGISSALGSFLYEVGPGDPVVTGATAAMLLTVAGLAAWIPARRAARADAVRCLREE